MAISEQARQALLRRLDEVLGPQHAWALMEEVGGRDLGALATKVDLDHLAALTSERIDALGHRLEATLALELGNVHMEMGQLHKELGQVYKEVAAHTRTTVFACIASVMTSSGVALASSRL